MNCNLPPLITSMLDESFYPHKCQEISLLQTQMSYIILTGDFVYKVKKPVNFGYLDYTTLEKRKALCQQEVELNRRLSPEVYLGSLPIYERGNNYSITGGDEIIEYAVKMLQLPQDRMFDKLLINRKISAEQLERLAHKIAAFHKQAAASHEINNFGSIESILFNIEENFSQTEKYLGKTITDKQFNDIKKYSLDFVNDNKSLFIDRINGGHIRDCHGDLHSAHICFTDGIYIFDCIEFNDRFRYSDTASEIAFLSMDIEYYGYYNISKKFVDSYISESGDYQLPRLFNFYRCYRAYVRGKVESFKSDDIIVPDGERKNAENRAIKYFHLSHQYANNVPHLIIMCGLVGTGKTTLAEAIRSKANWAILSSDISRKQLSNIPVTEHHLDEYDRGLYSEEFTRNTYDFLFEEAKALLSKNKAVIIDASFKKQEYRTQAIKLATELGARFTLVECKLDGKLIQERLERRKYQQTASDGRWEIYEKQKVEFDEVILPAGQHIIINTGEPPEKSAKKMLIELGLE